MTPQLTFGLGPHVHEIRRKMMTRSGIMGRLAGASWGWSKESMRVVYQVTQGSKAEYAAPAWAPWLSETSRQNKERAQLKAARHITGNIASTPTQLVLKEAGLPTLKERHEVGSVALLDRWMHLEEGGGRGRGAAAHGEVELEAQKQSELGADGRPGSEGGGRDHPSGCAAPMEPEESHQNTESRGHQERHGGSPAREGKRGGRCARKPWRHHLHRRFGSWRHEDRWHWSCGEDRGRDH